MPLIPDAAARRGRKEKVVLMQTMFYATINKTRGAKWLIS